MNAGAYDGEMKDAVVSVQVMTRSGDVKPSPVMTCSLPIVILLYRIPMSSFWKQSCW